jgi:hypothetical protein
LVRFSFLFLFHLLTACFSFIHIPSRSRLRHALPLCPPSLRAALRHAPPSPCRAALATSPLISCVASVASRLPFATRALRHASPLCHPSLHATPSPRTALHHTHALSRHPRCVAPRHASPLSGRAFATCALRHMSSATVTSLRLFFFLYFIC